MTPVWKPKSLFIPIFCAVLAFSVQPAAAEDSRAASFLAPPSSPEAVKEGKAVDLSAPPPFEIKTKKKVVTKTESSKTPEKKADKKKEESKPLSLAPEPKKEPKKEAEAEVEVEVPSRIVTEKEEDADEMMAAEEELEEDEPAPALLTERPLNLGAPVATALLADVDPETIGLLAPEQGGLGASLWKDASRPLVDRLMPAIALPTASYTLNDLTRRMFLTTAAAPLPSASGNEPKRSLMAQRLEGLMNLGAVRDAWKLFTLAEPSLVDPVTLTRLVEASLIGPESNKICEAVTGLMAQQSKQKEMQLDWQKSLLICQLRAGDKKAVQLSLAMMKEQGASRDIFMQLLERNVLGGKKHLPRHLTPLRPTVLALLREHGRPLPSYLYKKPAAYLVPELVKAKATRSRERVALAERSAAKGVLMGKQLVEVYQDVATEGKSKKKAKGLEIHRAKLYQAALHEELPQKKIELIQEYLKGLPKTYQVGVPGQIAADILETVPVASDYNSSALYMARMFAMTGRVDKAMLWLKLAKDVASRVESAKPAISQNWPVFVLAGMIPDGAYTDGLNAWLDITLTAGGHHAQRDYAGRVLLILSAAGYSVPETAWQSVVEIAPPKKQNLPSPVIMERMHQVAKAGRRGETILLSLLLQAGEDKPSLSVMVDTVRALRLAGLKTEMLSLAREALVALEPAKAK